MHPSRLALCLAHVCLFALLSSSPLLLADTVLNFPRLSFEPNTLTGIAFVNPFSQTAVLTITAYDTNGIPIAATGFQNPVQLTVPANQQISRLISEVFGKALPPSSVGWFQATSPVDGLTGFFLYLDGSDTFLDGGLIFLLRLPR